MLGVSVQGMFMDGALHGHVGGRVIGMGVRMDASSPSPAGLAPRPTWLPPGVVHGANPAGMGSMQARRYKEGSWRSHRHIPAGFRPAQRGVRPP